VPRAADPQCPRAAVVDPRGEAEQPAPVPAGGEEQPGRRPLHEVRIGRRADGDDPPVERTSFAELALVGAVRRNRAQMVVAVVVGDARAGGRPHRMLVLRGRRRQLDLRRAVVDDERRRPVLRLARVRKALPVRRPRQVAHVGGRYVRRRRVERDDALPVEPRDEERRRSVARRDECEAAAPREDRAPVLARAGSDALRQAGRQLHEPDLSPVVDAGAVDEHPAVRRPRRAPFLDVRRRLEPALARAVGVRDPEIAVARERDRRAVGRVGGVLRVVDQVRARAVGSDHGNRAAAADEHPCSTRLRSEDDGRRRGSDHTPTSRSRVERKSEARPIALCPHSRKTS
jgi:hypothetical protein